MRGAFWMGAVAVVVLGCGDGGSSASRKDACESAVSLTAAGGIYSATGTLDGTVVAPCAGRTSSVFRFTPPAGGTWLFRVEGEGTPSIALRPTCGRATQQRGCQPGRLVEVLDTEPVFIVVSGEGGDFNLTAEQAPRPRLREAQVSINPTYGTVGVEVLADAPGRPLVAVGLVLLDASGNPHPLTPIDDPARVVFDRVTVGPDGTIGRASGHLDDTQTITSARVWVVDEDAVESEMLEVQVTPPKAAGEVCDPLRAIDVCPDDQLCLPTGCGAPAPACPNDWPVVRGDGLPFRRDGNTSGASPRATGSCGGGSGNDVYAFTAPQSGTYLVDVESTGHPDPLVFVRSACDAADVAAELGCNDDFELGDVFHAGTVVALEAGQTAFVFVDGYAEETATGGAYTLEIRPVTAPALSESTASFNRADSALGVRLTGLDPEDDVAFAWIALVDGAGELLELDVVPNPFAIGFTTIEQDQGSFQATAAVAFLSGSAALAQLAQVAVWVADEAGLESELVVLPVEPAADLMTGGECDVLGAFGACPAGEACANRGQAGAPPICQTPTTECPAGWSVVDLSAAPEWRASAASDPRNHGELASCSSGGEDAVFSFVATQAGAYRFAIDTAEPNDSVLFARTHCGFSQPRYELACNDDISDADLLSAIEVTLEAQQVIYLFVAGYGGETLSQATVTAEQL